MCEEPACEHTLCMSMPCVGSEHAAISAQPQKVEVESELPIMLPQIPAATARAGSAFRRG
jgi:hypothetical protein